MGKDWGTPCPRLGTWAGWDGGCGEKQGGLGSRGAVRVQDVLPVGFGRWGPGSAAVVSQCQASRSLPGAKAHAPLIASVGVRDLPKGR